MQPETFHHIYNHANGFENLFKSEENYRYFLQQWGKYITPVADTYAYCLMPNHIHFLVRVKNESEVLKYVKLKQPTLQGFETLGGFSRCISLQYSHLFNSYTQAFNKMYGRKGSLFMPNFKRKVITNKNHLTNVIFYIHHNPVHHGFVDNIQGWSHSSFHSLLSDKKTLLERKQVLQYFDGIAPLKEFHQHSIKELDKMEVEFTSQ